MNTTLTKCKFCVVEYAQVEEFRVPGDGPLSGSTLKHHRAKQFVVLVIKQ